MWAYNMVKSVNSQNLEQTIQHKICFGTTFQLFNEISFIQGKKASVNYFCIAFCNKKTLHWKNSNYNYFKTSFFDKCMWDVG